MSGTHCLTMQCVTASASHPTPPAPSSKQRTGFFYRGHQVQNLHFRRRNQMCLTGPQRVWLLARADDPVDCMNSLGDAPKRGLDSDKCVAGEGDSPEKVHELRSHSTLPLRNPTLMTSSPVSGATCIPRGCENLRYLAPFIG